MGDIKRTTPRESSQHRLGVYAPEDQPLAPDEFVIVVLDVAPNQYAAERISGRVLQRVDQPDAGVQTAFTRRNRAVMYEPFVVRWNGATIAQRFADEVPSLQRLFVQVSHCGPP
jgi:hypothetical protein